MHIKYIIPLPTQVCYSEVPNILLLTVTIERISIDNDVASVYDLIHEVVTSWQTCNFGIRSIVLVAKINGLNIDLDYNSSKSGSNVVRFTCNEMVLKPLKARVQDDGTR